MKMAPKVAVPVALLALGGASLSVAPKSDLTGEATASRLVEGLDASRTPGRVVADLVWSSEVQIAYSTKESLVAAAASAPVLVLDMWMSPCGPCEQLKPELVKLQKDFADRGVLFIGVAGQSLTELAEARRYRDKGGMILAVGAKEFTNKYKVEGFPTVFVINADGTVSQFDGANQEKNIASAINAGLKNTTGNAQNVFAQAFDSSSSAPLASTLRRGFGEGVIPAELGAQFERLTNNVNSPDATIQKKAATEIVQLLSANKEKAALLMPDIIGNGTAIFSLVEQKDKIELVSVMTSALSQLEGTSERAVSAQSRHDLYGFFGFAFRQSRKFPEVQKSLIPLGAALAARADKDPDPAAAAAAFVNAKYVVSHYEQRLDKESAYFNTTIEVQKIRSRHPAGQALGRLSDIVGRSDSQGVATVLNELLERYWSGDKRDSNAEFLQARRFVMACLTHPNFATVLAPGEESNRFIPALSQALVGSLAAPDLLKDDDTYRFQCYSVIAEIGASRLPSNVLGSLAVQIDNDLKALNPKIAELAFRLKREASNAALEQGVASSR